MPLQFVKYEGLGNDFLVVEADTAPAAADVSRWCDRHFGVGGDGVLAVVPATSGEARARMIVVNADGSRPEMCGNGLRCVALHLALADGLGAGSFIVDTDAGPLLVEVDRDGERAEVKVGMGRATVLEPHRTSFEGRDYELVRVSTGNPHAVLFLPTMLDDATIDRLGPQVSSEIDQGANVELVTSASPTELNVVVWERGVGRTLACGTGACAVAVAAAHSRRAPHGEELRVTLPGGPLRIIVEPDSLQMTMRGPARLVFSGELP